MRYVNNNFIRRDGSNEVEGDISMNNHKLANIADPTLAQDAVTKHYADSRKPLITIWAQEHSSLSNGQYQWGFVLEIPVYFVDTVCLLLVGYFVVVSPR